MPSIEVKVQQYYAIIKNYSMKGSLKYDTAGSQKHSSR